MLVPEVVRESHGIDDDAKLGKELKRTNGIPKFCYLCRVIVSMRSRIMRKCIVAIDRGCSSAVLACTCLERESLLLPAMMSLVACCPLSDELGQCGELSLLHRFGLVSENECATKARGVQHFLLQKAGVYQHEQPQYTLLPQEPLVSGSEPEHYMEMTQGSARRMV